MFYHDLSFAAVGDPISVLAYGSKETEDKESPAEGYVRLEMKHAPVNPADLLTIVGKYVSPPFGFDRQSRYFEGRLVGGSEGIGVVTDIPDGTERLKEGSIVTVAMPGMGTFRSSLWVPSTGVLPLEKGPELIAKVGSAVASALPQLGGTALGMLKEFPLAPGSVIIQNVGNSGVGILVSQLAKRMNLFCVSVVRKGNKTEEEWSALKEFLTTVARADLILTEEDLATEEGSKEAKNQLKTLSPQPPMLGLNAVGGENATNMARLLGPKATLVTYGAASGKPVVATAADLVFRDLRFVGYWHSRRMVERTMEEKLEMVNELVQAVLDDELVCPAVEVFRLKDYKEALEFDAKQSGMRRKLVFDCTPK